MKNKFSLFVCAAIVSSVFGCGAGYEDQDLDNTGDLGTAEEAISIGNNGFGFSTAISHARCAQPGGLGQDCRIPGNVTTNIKWCPSTNFVGRGDFTGTQILNFIRKGISEFDAAVTGYTFQEVTSGSGTCQLFIGDGTVSGSGTNTADKISTFTPTGLTTLTSGAGVSHVNGTWKSFSSANVVIDTNKIASQSFAILVAPDAFQHLGGYVSSLFLGQGSRTQAPGEVPQYAMSNNFDLDYSAAPGLPLFVVSTGDKCRINGRNSAGSTVVQNTFTCVQ